MSTNYPPAPPPSDPGRPANNPNVGPHGQVPFPAAPSYSTDYQQAPQYQQAPPPNVAEAREQIRPNTGFGRAVLAALIWLVVGAIVQIAVVGGDAESMGTQAGILLIPALLAALAGWLLVRNRRQGVAFWQLVLIVLPFFLAIALLLTAVRMGGMAGAA